MADGHGIVRFRRGKLVESEHHFAWAVSDGDGAGGGRAVFARSSAKPFQALAAMRAGVHDRLRLEPRHLALACASHGGSEEHVGVVREILAAAGRGVQDLECGASEPRDPAAAAAYRERGGAPTAVRHNCSGKHAFGIALSVTSGWPVHGYLEHAHPLQQAMRSAVADATGLQFGDVGEATDGCGMRTFVVPLGSLAAAFGRLAGGGLGEHGDRLAAAMSSHPELVAYAGAIDTELMTSEPGAVAKIGAEGVLGIGLADGRGAAIKVLDGAERALEPAAVLVARERLGLTAGGAALERLAAPPLRNSHGARVGFAEAELLEG